MIKHVKIDENLPYVFYQVLILSCSSADIRCLQSSSREHLTATVLSSRPLVAPPVLTLRPAVNPLTSAVCAMTSSQDGRRLEVAVTNLEACGVESCVQPSGEVRRL